MPIGVLAGKAEFMDAFDGGKWSYGDASFPEVGVTFFAGTFVRHPLALAAAAAVLDRLEAEGPALQEALNERTARLVGRVNIAMERSGVPVRLGRFGSLFYPKYASDLKWASLLWFHLREKGIHIWEGRPCFLSTEHSDEDIERLYRAFVESVAEMQAGGFLPGEPVSLPGEGGTPAELAGVSGAIGSPEEGKRGGVSAPSLSPAEAEVERRVLLTEAQREVWLASQMSEAANCALIETVSVHLHGEIDVEKLRQAVQGAAGRHEALRTTFTSDGQYQVISPCKPLPVPIMDLSAREPERRAAELDDLLAAEGRTPFDLVNGPLFRTSILRLAEGHHVLILSGHHLVFDGWSSGLLLREIGQIYTAAVSGEMVRLPEPMRLGEYAAELASPGFRTESETAESYWLHQLEPMPSPLELPADRSRPAVNCYHGSRRVRRIAPELTAHLRRLGAKHGCTLYATLFAGFAAMLRRLSGHEDLVVGMTAAGQSQLGNPCLVSHCVNTLPVRIATPGAMPFREYLGQVRRTLFDAYDHQSSTFGRLLQNLPIHREPGQVPLVAVLFNLDRQADDLKFGHAEFAVETNPRSFYQFDLGFNVVETRDDLKIECDFNTDLFDPETIDRWLGHYETLLASAVDAPERALATLPLLSAAEREEMLVGWNATRFDYAQDRCAHQLIEEQAQCTPEAVAILAGERRLTYREMNAQADRLADRLRAVGVARGARVAVCVERTPEMVVALLAVHKAGAAYIPLDPLYPKERIALVLEDASPTVLLTQSSLLYAAPDWAGRTLLLDADDGVRNTAAQSEAARPEDPAYVIYTSGSTGKPKGVQVPHRALVNFLQTMQREPGLRADDTLLAVTTLAFDIAGLELFLPLIAGARLVIATKEETVDGGRLISLLERHGVTVMQATPATWRLLLSSGWKGKQDLRAFCGGEALPMGLALELLHKCGGLWNLYGPTETTIWSSVLKIERPEDALSIGRPIGNTQMYILDDERQPVPVGVPGELYIGGDGVADGYLGRPELTAEKFVPDPFSGIPNARLYRTGDQAKFLPSGRIAFLGRLDLQVKLRGFRIELGEIEHVLREHPCVREAVVVLREAKTGEPFLAAYYVPTRPEAVSTANLRSRLQAKLPPYMIPARFIPLDVIPLTPNGKVDRKALPAPKSVDVEAVGTAAPPDELEQRLAALWAMVLEIQDVPLDASFFDLGGHSLLALRLYGHIEKELGVRLPFQTIFQAPTVAELATIVRRERKPAVADRSHLVPIQPNGTKPPLFCIHPDHGLVLFYNDLAKCLSPDQPVFGIQSAGLDGEEEPDVRIEDMAARHVREIIAHYPSGPYFIAGFSLGGVAAFEMARQLHAAGREVGLLALFDAYAPVAIQKNLLDKSRLQRVRGHVRVMLEVSPKEKLDYLKDKSREAVYGRKSPAERAAEELKDVLDPKRLEALKKVLVANETALNTYETPAYAGKGTLFRAKKLSFFENYDPHLWWGDTFQGGLEIIDVPGDHFSMMKEPHVRALGEALQACLDRQAVLGLSR
jgi:amino acid adenylation domain-containing protein